eukprot:TRINITY_DN571_c0_g1_i2.p1 TRINITY_DN571_c0_g1~~TRINITY_DN571_c0_g1_i2.p1  ORF type:complete len:263 (+),score=16.27 TRINITY_DN571_c0_g1_i2:84-872(+)
MPSPTPKHRAPLVMASPSTPTTPVTPGRKGSSGSNNGTPINTPRSKKSPMLLKSPPTPGKKSPGKRKPSFTCSMTSLQLIFESEAGGERKGLKVIMDVCKTTSTVVASKAPPPRSGKVSPRTPRTPRRGSPVKRKVAKKEKHPKLLPVTDDGEGGNSPVGTNSPLASPKPGTSPGKLPPPFPDTERVELNPGLRSVVKPFSLVPAACPMESLPAQHHHLAKILEACCKSPHALARAVNALHSSSYDFYGAQQHLKKKVTLLS